MVPRPWRGGDRGGDCVDLYFHLSTLISIYLLPLYHRPRPYPHPGVGNRGCATVSKQTLPFRGGEAKFASEENAVISNEGL